MRTLDVGIDMDGVVYDYVAALREWMIRITARDAAAFPDPRVRAFAEDWGLTKDEFLAMRRESVLANHLYRVGTPMPGAAEGVRSLMRAGHRVHIVTARVFPGIEEVAFASTRWWLDAYDMPYTSLTFDPDKSVVPADIFLEDSAANYDVLEAVSHQPWLYTQAWNADHPGRRVRRWSEFCSIVDRHARALID